ncbi:MAG TPA: hypothetical protein VE907_04435 [Gammaproteobacteria bacterium]|nr:hypothetical protein [Gammaproteobacteria bacterium]
MQDDLAFIQETIRNLEALALMLEQDSDEWTRRSDAFAEQARRRKEARLTLSVLLAKLHAVSAMEEPLRQPPRPICINCDD